MKVVLINNYGGRIPREIRQYVTGNDHSWRWGKVVQHIESIAIPAGDSRTENAKVVRYCGTRPNEKTYLFQEEMIIISIIDVDITRPWTILNYDGAEYVQYLDYKKISELYGLCQLPNS